MKSYFAAVLAAAIAAVVIVTTPATASEAGATVARAVQLTQAAGMGCSNASFKPEQFEVAIDRPSGITFIATPCGWSYVGVVSPDAIDQGIQLSQAKPVPAEVLAAELVLQPWLKNFGTRLSRN
jgi:hypothetical protein